MNKISVFLLLLLFLTEIGWTDQKEISQTPWQPNSSDYANRGSLGDLREFHEATIFVLKRYATLEALVSARELGKQENEAFGVGTASLIPGVGQLLNEDYIQGGLLLFSTLTSWGTAQQLSFTKKKNNQNQGLLPFYYTSLLLKNGIMTYSMLHASNGHYTSHHDKTAAIWTGMSSMIPGIGQAINGDWWSGAGMLAAWSLATILTSGLEEKVFISGNENYLVKQQERSSWAIALLPGGAMLGYSTSW